MDMPVNTIEGWMLDQELRWLFDQAQAMNSIVEIGSWFGRSTFTLLSACPGTVYAVDTFKGSTTEMVTFNKMAHGRNAKDEFVKNVGHFKNLVLLEKDSLEASQCFAEQSVDMIFIDGDHDYPFVKRDLAAWFPKHKKLFCGHDIQWPGVERAVTEFRPRFKRTAGSIWVI